MRGVVSLGGEGEHEMDLFGIARVYGVRFLTVCMLVRIWCIAKGHNEMHMKYQLFHIFFVS
jgi:hypothetical protein